MSSGTKKVKGRLVQIKSHMSVWYKKLRKKRVSHMSVWYKTLRKNRCSRSIDGRFLVRGCSKVGVSTVFRDRGGFSRFFSKCFVPGRHMRNAFFSKCFVPDRHMRTAFFSKSPICRLVQIKAHMSSGTKKSQRSSGTN